MTEGSGQAVDVNQTPLPGVGLRYDFTTRSGRQIGVVSHRSGRRDLLVYDRKDPDSPLRAGDTAVVVGTPRGIAALARLLDG
jgi:TrkA domain protein